jgi:dTDP-4-amino-4,6-dideoxygalactose transaminase
VRGGKTAVALFEEGLCLPSGSNLSESDQDRIIAVIEASCESTRLCAQRAR